MTWYPEAERVPWKYNGPRGPSYYKGLNKPKAVVLHVMQGYASTARQWANTGYGFASWHFTVARDGSVMQHLDTEDGGYHAGIPDSAPRPTWSRWQGRGINVNHYTIGIEHEGFSGVPFTEAQMKASKKLCEWLAHELSLPFNEDFFPPHAAIDIVNRPNDFHPPAMRQQFYDYLFEEEDMTPAEVEAIVRRIVREEIAKDNEGDVLATSFLDFMAQAVGAAPSTFALPDGTPDPRIVQIRDYISSLARGGPDQTTVLAKVHAAFALAEKSLKDATVGK